jgi:hypothetical protein
VFGDNVAALDVVAGDRQHEPGDLQVRRGQGRFGSPIRRGGTPFARGGGGGGEHLLPHVTTQRHRLDGAQCSAPSLSGSSAKPRSTALGVNYAGLRRGGGLPVPRTRTSGRQLTYGGVVLSPSLQPLENDPL